MSHPSSCRAAAYRLRTSSLLLEAGRALVDVLPDGRRFELARQGHNVSMKALAPVVEAFFARD